MIKYLKALVKLIALSLMTLFLVSNIEAKSHKAKSSKTSKSKTRSGKKSRYKRIKKHGNGPDLKKITSESASKVIYKDEPQNGVNPIEIDQKN